MLRSDFLLKSDFSFFKCDINAEIKMDAARVSMCLAIFKLICNRSLNNVVISLSIYCLPL